MKKFDELDKYSCRAVLGDNMYCGEPAPLKGSWCPEHCKIYTIQPKKRNLDTDKPFDNYSVSQNIASRKRGFRRKTR